MAVNPFMGRMTVEEFLDAEMKAEEKHELFHGVVWAMAGAGKTHLLVTPALHSICRRALRGSGCTYFDQDLKVVVRQGDDSVFYPDGTIACPAHFVEDRSGAIDNPKVIFEVLSPSTELHDRTEKFRSYEMLPSFQDYVLISTKQPLVEVLSRQTDGSWVLRAFLTGSSAQIPSVGIEIPLDELYEDAVFEAADATPVQDLVQ